MAVGRTTGATFGPRLPRRRRMRWSPSLRAISLRSCWLMSRTRSRTVRTSNGRGLSFASANSLPLSFPGALREYGQGAQFPRNVGQYLATIRRDQDIVLDPHATPAGQVDPRLDG